MSRKNIKSIVVFLLVFATLFSSATVVFAKPISVTALPDYEQGGVWSNLLDPFLYSPAEVVQPDLSVDEGAVEAQRQAAPTALQQFATTVINGNASLVSGVFVEDVMAFPVVQQPSGSAAYVSTQADVVTQFALAEKYGTIGILAHNFLAGTSFFNLSSGQDVYVVYGDGSTAHFVIKSVRRFQALQPNSAYSEFVDLDSSEHYTSSEVFYEVYGNNGMLVLQTCIAAEGVDSWGRLFVTAEKVS